MSDCPKCHHELIDNQVSEICPNCDYIHMKKIEWKGDTTTCPRCNSEAKVFKHKTPGKSFICDNCKTVGKFMDEKNLKTKVVKKDTETGKRLSWLFEVPCEHWKKREEVIDTLCAKCEMKEVCDAHLDEIDRLSKKKGVDIYIHNDHIEIVHG